MSFIGWIIIGGVAGWLAGIILGSRSRGCLMNVIIGVAGAFIGGFVMRLVTGQPFDLSWDWSSLIVATIGAVLLLAITGMGRR